MVPLADAAGVQLLELLDLGVRDVHEVRVGAVLDGVVLVIGLRRVKVATMSSLAVSLAPPQ